MLKSYYQGIIQYTLRRKTSEDKIQKTYVSKDEFIKGLENLHVGEWKKKYFAPVLDGMQWELKLKFSSGNTKTYFGSNAYPFSFWDMIGLFSSLVDEDE